MKDEKKEKVVRPRSIRRLFKRLCAQRCYPFPQKGIGIVAPEKQGVYIIKKAQVIWHVGRTTRAKKGLKQRLTSHLRGRSSFMAKIFHRKGDELRKGFKYQYLEVPGHQHRAILEAYAAGCLCPRHFGTSESQVVNKPD